MSEKSEPGPGTTVDDVDDDDAAAPGEPPTTTGNPPERKVGATKATTSQNLAKTEGEFDESAAAVLAKGALEA